MNNKQIGPNLTFAIGLVAVSALSAGVYYYAMKLGPAVTVTNPDSVVVVRPPRTHTTPKPAVAIFTVDGMKLFTDAKFGFSFWYPASADSEKTPAKNDPHSMFNISDVINGPRTEIKKVITLPDITFYEVYSPNMSILSAVDAGPIGSAYNKYFFDPITHAWMYADEGMPSGKAATTTADITNNTMGGLHIFNGYTRFSHKVIIPLSAQNFIVAYSRCNNATDYLCDAKNGTNTTALEKFNAYVKTVTATDPSAGAPVSADDQLATVQALAKSYGPSN